MDGKGANREAHGSRPSLSPQVPFAPGGPRAEHVPGAVSPRTPREDMIAAGLLKPKEIAMAKIKRLQEGQDEHARAARDFLIGRDLWERGVQDRHFGQLSPEARDLVRNHDEQTDEAGRQSDAKRRETIRQQIALREARSISGRIRAFFRRS